MGIMPSHFSLHYCIASHVFERHNDVICTTDLFHLQARVLAVMTSVIAEEEQKFVEVQLLLYSPFSFSFLACLIHLMAEHTASGQELKLV